MEIRDIYFYMYSFFYGTFMHVSTNNLDSLSNSTFQVGGRSPDYATDISIAHTLGKNKEKPGKGERIQIE